MDRKDETRSRKSKIELILAWTLLITTFAGAVVEPIIFRTIIETFLSKSDGRTAVLLLSVFMFFVLPVFVFSGFYSVRQIRIVRRVL